MDLRTEALKIVTRRQFFRDCSAGLGTLGLASLLNHQLFAGSGPATGANPLAPRQPHFTPKAKNIIFLHMAGAPSQLDLFDYKPKLVELNNQPVPESFTQGDRFAFIKGVPKLLGTPHEFKKHGQAGIEISSALPHLAGVADELCVIRSMKTDQFNHAPAQLLLYTGSPRFGAASMGSWITYGLGSENQNLPGFVVLISGGTDPSGGKSLWGSGFLPSIYQGVEFRSKGDPVLYVSNPLWGRKAA
jgi:hypothetical protein